MSIRKLPIVLAALLLLVLMPTEAAWAGNNSTRLPISYFKIGSGRIVVYFQTGFTALDNAQCTGSNQAIAVAIDSSRDEYRELVAAVMLAQGSGIDIAFWLDGSCSPASGGGPFPQAVQVYVYST